MRVFCTPNTSDVEKFLKDNYRNNDVILHIVPTMILQVRRQNFYRKQILKMDTQVYRELSEREKNSFFKDKGIYIFEINHLMKQLVLESNYKHVTNREALIIIERLMNNMPELSHYTWISLSPEIKKLYDLFTISNLDIDILKSFSNDVSWSLILELYSRYINYLSQNNIMDEAMVFNKVIKSSILNKFNKVYIDGSFLPITPLLQRIIDRLENINKEICYFIPYDLNRKGNPIFRVLEKTYSQFVPIDQWENLTEKYNKHNVVNQLANYLFESTDISVNDRSLKIRQYNNFDEELREIIEDIKTKINKLGVRANKIAIVTPNAMKYRPIVKEMLELSDIKLRKENRPLIDLPIGKFISLLYQIYIDERIEVFELPGHYIDIDLFESLLHLNIINSSNTVITTFELLKTFFIDCRTFNTWYEKLAMLKQGLKIIKNHGTKYNSHPLYHITQQDLDLLEQDLRTIEALSGKLLNLEMPVSKHIEYLVNFIEKIDLKSEYIAEEKNEIIERLNTYKAIVEENENLVISSEEFGRRILSLLNAPYQIDELNETEEVVKNITVTGPNNIEYQEYDYIYLARFTQSIYPESQKYFWPLTKKITYQLLKHSTKIAAKNINDYSNYLLDRALYHFFIVLNSVDKGLCITFSKEYDQIEQTPSHYLFDIADALLPKEYFNDIQIDNTEEMLLNGLEELAIYRKPSGLPKKAGSYVNQDTNLIIKEGTEIFIEDIAIYELCPRRLYYEKNFEESSIYTSRFQLNHYAAACVYEKAVKKFIQRHSKISKDNIEGVALQVEPIVNELKQEFLPLFPLPKQDWEDIENRTIGQLTSFIKDIVFKYKPNTFGAVLKLEGQHISKNIGEYNFKGNRELKVSYYKNKEDYYQDKQSNNNRYFTISNLKKLLVINVLEDVKHRYFELLSGFCRGESSTKTILLNYADKISEKKYPKKSGDHCHYCPFTIMCKEKVLEVDEVDR